MTVPTPGCGSVVCRDAKVHERLVAEIEWLEGEVDRRNDLIDRVLDREARLLLTLRAPAATPTATVMVRFTRA